MTKYILAALLLTIPVFPALAQNDMAQNNLALCKLLAQHTASPGAAYQPGVDVHGKPVVPADVNAAPSMVPDVIRIPMTVDLAQRLGTVPTGMELKANTGMVEIHKDGKVIFNGQDMTTQSVAVCDNHVPVEPSLPPQTLGQLTIPAPQSAPDVGERTNVDLEKDDEIIWGQGN